MVQHPLLTCPTQEIRLRSVLNALAISYHCRLPERRLRHAYREQIYQILTHHGVHIHRKSHVKDVINYLLTNEKNRWVDHMKLPEMTALNEALVENIFVGTPISFFDVGSLKWGRETQKVSEPVLYLHLHKSSDRRMSQFDGFTTVYLHLYLYRLVGTDSLQKLGYIC